jgi:hypothetical protein
VLEHLLTVALERPEALDADENVSSRTKSLLMLAVAGILKKVSNAEAR